MKLGILGTGMIVKDFTRTIADLNFEKVYLLGTENTREETENMVELCNFTKSFYDYDELLNSDLDTIYVALPNHLHYAFSKKALLAGKHVIIEKPITSNATELKELIEIAHEKKLIMVEAMNIPYMPAYMSLKEDLNKLGKIKIVSFNYSQYSSRYNAFKEGTVLPAFDYMKSGGALMDLNVYNIHAIVGLFGEPKDVEYFANIERNIDTSGTAVLDYETFKAVAIGAKDCKAPLMCTVQGDEGYIKFNVPASQMREYELCDNKGNGETKHFDAATHRMFYEFTEFKKMIENLDYARADEMMKSSLAVSEVMTEARRKAGIVFGVEMNG